MLFLSKKNQESILGRSDSKDIGHESINLSKNDVKLAKIKSGQDRAVRVLRYREKIQGDMKGLCHKCCKSNLELNVEHGKIFCLECWNDI